MRRTSLALAFAAAALPALAGPTDDYRDDRSTPETVIASLYNAVNRMEYARAWGYFAQDHKPSANYAKFAAGYQGAYILDLRIGEATGDAGMSHVYTALPVAFSARDPGGRITVYAGCYLTQQIAPGVQEPPFRGIEIIGGKLSVAKATSASAALPASCDPDKVPQF